MEEIALVGYSEDDHTFTLMEYGKGLRHFTDVVELVRAVAHSGNKEMVWDMKVMFCGAMSQAGLWVYDDRGQAMNEPAVDLPKISYITRAEVGNLLPDGWFIEHQLNRYAACHGEDITLPHRTTMERAIMDLHAFLASVVAQATHELVSSMAVQLERQENMFD